MPNRKFSNTIILTGLSVILLSFIILRSINRSIENQVSRQMQKIKIELAQDQNTQVSKQRSGTEKRELKPSNLTEFQIIPHRKSELFKNQQYWDVLTKDALHHSKIITNPETQNTFKGIAKSQSQYKKQIAQIDERIYEYKQKVSNNPSDGQAKQKLQNLYMIKSTIRALKETIVSE